ncbi:MAG: hypothetical protein NTZ26_15030 [Candidatus Aminicenantes bacterium]|nr:hypothetical protein [Candidatus Aminicenantes bacterium]
MARKESASGSRRQRVSWRLKLSLALVVASAATYGLHYLLFRDLHHIAIYLVGDIAFLFLNILVVTLVIDGILARREKTALLRKMNMVIGTFFSDVGFELLGRFPSLVRNAADLAPRLAFEPRWQKKDFQAAICEAREFAYDVAVSPDSLICLRDFLRRHREFLLRLLENPNLLEHERFTDLLWAVFHVVDELEMRGDALDRLPPSDMAHLANDVKRAFSQLAGEWVAYAQHLKASYPFLFSLIVRVNPFSASPSPIVQD